MQTHQRSWKNVSALLEKWFAKNVQRNVPARILQRGCIVLLILLVLGTSFAFNGEKADARVVCPWGAIAYRVVHGDTLSKIASYYGLSWPRLAADNHLANPNRIYPRQIICVVKGPKHIHGHTQQSPKRPAPSAGSRNVFPYGSCTWWADQRYFQLYGVFVPWKTQASAWQWVARAYQFGWKVSSWPTPGAIVVLQPWVEGAYGSGHVAVVERILRNGRAIASNMSWGRYPWLVTYVQFAPGRGVAFVSRT